MSETERPRYERRTLALQLAGGFAELVWRHYEPQKARRTVLCIHDFLGNSKDFGELASMLVGHGYRVVCPDLPGRGESAYLTDPAAYNPHTYVVAVLTLMQTLAQRRISVIGKGWGAMLAIALGHLPEVTVSRIVAADLPPTWQPRVASELIAAAQDGGFPTLEAARATFQGTEEFAGPYAAFNLPIIDGRLQRTATGLAPAFDPALLATEVLKRRVSTRRIYEGLKSRLLYLSANAIGENHRERLRELVLGGPNRAYADSLAPGGRIHFNTGHQLLLTYGFLESGYTPNR